MPAAPYTVRSRGLRAERVELRVQSGRKIIAQGKRSAALGNEAIMNIGVGGWLPQSLRSFALGYLLPAPPGRQTEPPGSAILALKKTLRRGRFLVSTSFARQSCARRSGEQTQGEMRL